MLKKPCDSCPFRTDVKPYLRPGRITGIGEALIRGGGFPCHKTTSHDDDGESRRTGKEQPCAGAALVLEHEYDGPSYGGEGPGCFAAQDLRFAARFGDFDPTQLDTSVEVFESFDEADEAQG